MSNELTVVYGDQVPYFTLEMVARDHIGQEVDTTPLDEDYDVIVHNECNMSMDEVWNVIHALSDHIESVEDKDWLQHQHDMLVDVENNLWVDVAFGTYHGPNCTVYVYKVTI